MVSFGACFRCGDNDCPVVKIYRSGIVSDKANGTSMCMCHACSLTRKINCVAAEYRRLVSELTSLGPPQHHQIVPANVQQPQQPEHGASVVTNCDGEHDAIELRVVYGNYGFNLKFDDDALFMGFVKQLISDSKKVGVKSAVKLAFHELQDEPCDVSRVKKKKKRKR